MFNVSNGPGYEESFDPRDPLNRIPPDVEERSNAMLSIQIDQFVRAALAKAISPETLELFVNMHMPIPSLDLNLVMETMHRRRMSVVFNGQELGCATFQTKAIENPDRSITVVHEALDVVL